MKRRHKNKREESKIVRLLPLEDEVGKYVGVCNFSLHPGIVIGSYNVVCESRNCRYYERYRRIVEDDLR